MTVLERNLAAIDRGLAARIAAAAQRDDEIVTTARDGSSVNGVSVGGRPRLFHSGYNPVREAARLADGPTDAGFVVVLGAGSGYHVRALLERGVVVSLVEPDPALLRSCLQRMELRDWLRRGLLSIRAPERLGEDALDGYLAPVHGDLALVELPGRVGSDPTLFGRVRDRVRAAARTAADDTATQARFGIRWMRNTILNLARAKPTPAPSFAGKNTTVAAAGPSLNRWLAADRRDHTVLLAVDTALPVLIGHRIVPDLVVSIDCQLSTYHHFLSAGFPHVPVAAELSMSPSLMARLPMVVPCLSDHPVHRLVAHLGFGGTYVDVRGGNVGQAAVGMAVTLGSSAITMVGADFAYPGGETYARGSYLLRHLASRAGRLKPLAGLSYRFLVERPGIRRSPDDPHTWRQPLLDAYADRMRAYLDTLPVTVEWLSPPSPGRDAAPHPARETRRPPSPGASPRIFDNDALLVALRDAFTGVSTLDSFLASLGRAEPGTPARENPELIDRLAGRALLPLVTALRAESRERDISGLHGRAIEITNALIDHARSIA